MKIYAVNTEAFETIQEESWAEWLDLLDNERRERMKQLKQKKTRVQSLSAGLLLRYSFLKEGYTKEQWKNIEIQRGMYGKPQLVQCPAFCYSLSHSGKWVVCGVHSKELGLDIQERCSWSLKIAKRFFSEEECERLEEADSEQAKRQFYKIWAAKESFGKLTGEGIGKGISQYLTSVDFDKVTDTHKQTDAQIRIYEHIPEYTICVCTREKNSFPDEIEVISVKDLK